MRPGAKDHAKASELFPNDWHFRYVLASASYQELLTLVNGMRAASRAVDLRIDAAWPREAKRQAKLRKE